MNGRGSGRGRGSGGGGGGSLFKADCIQDPWAKIAGELVDRGQLKENERNKDYSAFYTVDARPSVASYSFYNYAPAPATFPPPPSSSSSSFSEAKKSNEWAGEYADRPMCVANPNPNPNHNHNHNPNQHDGGTSGWGGGLEPYCHEEEVDDGIGGLQEYLDSKGKELGMGNQNN